MFRNLYELNKYIKELEINQNLTNSPCLQDIFSKKDYYQLLQGVLKVIKENPHASITTKRLILFEKSGLKELINYLIWQTKITPGLVLDFGTINTRDTVLCGMKEEIDSNGIYNPKPMEENTIFDLASTSKLLTTIAILKLEEFGVLDLYAPITSYVKEFKYLDQVTVYDLLKFRIMIVTDKRVDSAKTKEEAEQILFTAHPKDDQNFSNAYTDMGAMVLRYVVEKTSRLTFDSFLTNYILMPLKMYDTHLVVPEEKRTRVASENYSARVLSDGTILTKADTYPGIQHDDKALAIGAQKGIAPGHAGYFSTKNDLIKLANALINYTILSKEAVLSISDNITGFKDNEEVYTRFYGSLVYLKQPDPKFLSVYPPLSVKAFISPGFAGTTLCVDPINKISLFIGANRLHNRIYSVSPNRQQNIITHQETNLKTYPLGNGEEKIICETFTKDKEVLVKLALDLALQYQFLERLCPKEKKLHLVRELN